MNTGTTLSYESIYYDLKQGSGLAPNLATQVAREIGRRVVSGT